MKKLIFLALGLSVILHSCIWENPNYSYSAGYDMYYSWRQNSSSIIENYVVKAFMFNVWYEGNDTVRHLVAENYFKGHENVRQADDNAYELCGNPDLPHDWYYRFETNGTSLNTPGATWTVYANGICEEGYDYSVYTVLSTLLTRCRKITITCVGANEWSIVCEESDNEHNKIQWTMKVTNAVLPLNFQQASVILTGNSIYELPEVSDAGDTVYTYLFAEIEEPLECSSLFTPEYGKVKIWAERDGKRSTVISMLEYQQGACEITESK